jgi:hypothetical protein
MKTLIPAIFTTLAVQPQAFTYQTASQNWKVDRAHPLHEPIKPNPVIHLCDHGSYIEANKLDVLGSGNDHGGSTVYKATLYTKKNPCGEKIALKRITRV